MVVTGLCAVGYQVAGFAVFATAYLVAVYSAMRAGYRVATGVTSLIVLVALPVAAMVYGRNDASEAFTEARGVLELAWLIAAAAAGEALPQAERRRARPNALARRARCAGLTRNGRFTVHAELPVDRAS